MKRNSVHLLVLVLGVVMILMAAALPQEVPALSWPMFRHDRQHSGRSSYIGPQDNSIAWVIDLGSPIKSSPAVDTDGTIYITTEDGFLHALNPDGTIKWSYPMGGGASQSSPAIGQDGTIYVGSMDHNIYAVNRDGTLKWIYPTEDEIYSSPSIGDDGTICIASYYWYLYAINPDGSLKCQTPIGYLVSSPAIGSDGTIYIGDALFNKLHAINSDCTLKCEGERHANVINSSPALSQDESVVYYGADDGYFYARNTSDCSFKWRSPYSYGGVQSSAAVGSDGTVYVGTQYGYLWALDPNVGTAKWEYYTTLCVWSSPAIGADGTVYFATFYGHIFAMNPDGSVKWVYEGNFPEDGHFYSSPAIGANGVLYIGSSNGKFYAFGCNEVTVFSPNGGEVIPSGSTYPISWCAPGDAATFSLKYSLNNGSTWRTIANGITGTSYNWDVPTPIFNREKCLISITGYDAQGMEVGYDESDGPFTIEVVRILTPTEGETLTSRDTYTITWRTNGTRNPVSKVSLYYTSGPWWRWKKIRQVKGNPGEYEWKVPRIRRSCSNCKLMVVLSDRRHRIVGLDIMDGYFTIQR